MNDTYLQQLSSADADERRQAILELTRLGETRALASLANIYRNDPEPAIRELALKAGRHLKALQAKEPVTQTQSFQLTVLPGNPAVSPPGGGELIPPLAPPQPVVKEITRTQKSLAKGKLESALTNKMQGQDAKALGDLVRAVELNPELEKDIMAINLAATLTGISPAQEAMAVVVQKAQEAAAGKGRRGPSAPKETTPVAIDSTLINVVILAVILFVLLCMLNVVLKHGLINLFNIAQESRSLSPDEKSSADFAEAKDDLAKVTVGEILSGGLLYGAGELVWFIIIYMVSAMMGGAADLFKFLERLLLIDILVHIILTLACALALFGISREMPLESVGGLLVICLGMAALAYLGRYISTIISVAQLNEVGIIKAFFIVLVAGFASSILSGILGVF